jgi:exo-1,4-beta-D-glucosaminidase
MLKARLSVFFSLSVIFFLAGPCAHSQSLSDPGTKLFLHSNWRLQSSCQFQATGWQISEPDFSTAGWHTTSVPSTVVAALVADGTYPDPDYGMNLRKIPGTEYPIGANFANMPMPKDSPFACSWWYRTEFSLPKELEGRNLWLHFDGINYRANIWFNGKKLADSQDDAGSYRISEFNATSFMLPGQTNVLAVETFAPTENDLAMNWVDWNPMPPDKDMGLWGSVYLTSSGPVAIRHPMVATHFPDASLDTAELTVLAEVHNASAQAVSAVVQGTMEELRFEQTVELAPGETRTVTFSPRDFPQLRVAHPKIWWPYGLGSQNLHNLAIRASVAGAVSDVQHLRFGIREITSEFNEHGSLQFRINGKRILIRGGGWAPDMLLRESHQRLVAQFDYVREMGLNTIRLEGKIENDDFFNLADERGVLVFAGWCCCSIWERWAEWKPGDLAIAAAQLRSQILRLRGHPSLLAWLNGSDMPPPAEVERAYIEVLKQESWPNPYLSSASQELTSVTGPSGVKMTGPYDYVPPEYWYEEKDKQGGAHGFNTETSPGPAPPVAASLRKMMPADQIWPFNEYWHFHACSESFQNLAAFDDAMSHMYGPPKDLADYEKKAQAMTYAGERAMFEAYAANKYVSTGVIQWMLNNAWPSLYWHLYDYFLQPAGGFFGAKKANELLHVQYSYGDRSVVVVNSQYQSFPGLSVTAQVYDFDLKPIFSRRVELTSAPDSSQSVLTLPALPSTPSPQVFFIKLALQNRSGETLSSNFYWLSNKVPVFEWYWTTYQRTEEYSYEDLTELANLPAIKLDVTASREASSDGDLVRVHLRNPSAHLAFQIRLAVTSKQNGGEILPVFWVDNYLELMPGESRTITARYPSGTKLPSDSALEYSAWNVAPATLALSGSTSAASDPVKVSP